MFVNKKKSNVSQMGVVRGVFLAHRQVYLSFCFICGRSQAELRVYLVRKGTESAVIDLANRDFDAT